MPSTRKLTNKSGQTFYEIRVRVSRDRPELTRRWYPPEGWSLKAIERELAKQAAEFERQCKAGEVLSRSEQKEKKSLADQEAAAILTVKQFGEQVFMPAKKITIAENTRSGFQTILDKHVYPVIGELKLPEVTSAEINALLLDYQGKGAAHSSCIRVYGVLNLLFKMAYMDDVIEKNPMDKVQRPRPRKDEAKKTEPESFTVDELKYIFECLGQEPLKWQAMIRLMADTGIRRGEACGLMWSHVDFDENTITICQTLNYTTSRGTYVSTTKNGRQRVIDVDPAVMELLRRLRIQQAEKSISQYVFTKEYNSEPIAPQTPTQYMKKFSERYGIEGMHPHKLRHSFASIALTNGADVVSISQILGHSDTAVTLRVYAHADKESRRRASNVFREALKDKKQA